MPKPFFTKLVAISAIGFFCVLFGCIFGIATHDRLFILMSLLIGICSILRALSFYHLIHTHAYLSLDVNGNRHSSGKTSNIGLPVITERNTPSHWKRISNSQRDIGIGCTSGNHSREQGNRCHVPEIFSDMKNSPINCRNFRIHPFRQKMSRPYCITPTVLAAHFIINNLSYFYQTIVFVSASMP